MRMQRIGVGQLLHRFWVADHDDRPRGRQADRKEVSEVPLAALQEAKRIAMEGNRPGQAAHLWSLRKHAHDPPSSPLANPVMVARKARSSSPRRSAFHPPCTAYASALLAR